jgi:hypothetical protein
MNNFIKTADINIKDINVNNKNARHGAVKNEHEAIKWLLNDNPNRLKALAKDIASKNMLLERPLVKKEGEKYVVYDGNRRTTCMKLLHNPNKAGDLDWIAFFKNLKDTNPGIPEIINCDIATDIEYINNLVASRHTGGDIGSGQVKWNRDQKENHLILTGQKAQPSFPVLLQNELIENGLLGPEETLKHSIFDRLFSNDAFRKRAGFSINKNGSVEFIMDKNEVLNTLLKIHNDSESKRVTLKEFWNNDSKVKYLDELEKGKFLPVTPAKSAHPTPQDLPLQTTTETNKPSLKPNKQTKPMPSLIDVDCPLAPKTNDEIKIKAIWDEMQKRMDMKKHIYSLGVMIRVLLELSTDYYIEKHKVSCKQNASLGPKMGIVIKELQNISYFSASEASILEGKCGTMINKMHAFVHGTNAHPTSHDLIALWGDFKKYITGSLTK